MFESISGMYFGLLDYLSIEHACSTLSLIFKYKRFIIGLFEMQSFTAREKKKTSIIDSLHKCSKYLYLGQSEARSQAFLLTVRPKHGARLEVKQPDLNWHP